MPDLSKIPAVDVVIGLAFVYFLLSLVISSLTEAVASVLQLRWRTLQRGLRELFENSGTDGDGAKDEGSRLWEAFRNDPRILALWKETGILRKRGPSYIPPRVFALTLLDTLVPPGDPKPLARGGEVANPPEADVTERVAELKKSHDVVAQAKVAAATVQNPVLRKWLVDALTQAGNRREEILKELESSFDSLTNRVSGWYKRHTSIWVFVFAVAVTGALNVDSYAIGSRLWKDEAVRSAVAGQAGKLTDPAVCPSRGSHNAGTLEKATECVTDLKSLALPIGWAKENQATGWGWTAKVGGWTVTVFALLLGAPFWFDTLSKLARLRNTGKPEGTAKGDTGKPKN